MTNTIPNVPRELLERLRSYIPNGDGHNSQYANDLADAVVALEGFAAPSPDGVDGLNTDRNAAFKACPESGCDWGSFYLGWKARGEVEQAIIDVLQEKIERLQFSLEVAKTDELSAAVYAETESIKHSLWDAEKERDQQAQRIGELEGLLREWRRMFDGGLESGQLGVLRGQTDAALSAGKEG